MGGVADRGVVHAQVVADRAHHHEAGVEPHPHGRAAPRSPGATATAVAPERARDPERGQRGAARVVLVGDRRAEERHEPVAEELVDRAFVAMHLGERGLEEAAEEDVHALGAEPLGQRGRADHVAEEHGDRLALALERAAGGEDLLGEVPRRVRPRDAGGSARRPRRGRPRARRTPSRTSRSRRELRPAGAAGSRAAGRRTRGRTSPGRILMPTLRTSHREPDPGSR